VAAFEDAGFTSVGITERVDCFESTSKQNTARRYGVIGANVSAIRQ